MRYSEPSSQSLILLSDKESPSDAENLIRSTTWSDKICRVLCPQAATDAEHWLCVPLSFSDGVIRTALCCHLETLPPLRGAHRGATSASAADWALLRTLYWELSESCKLVRKSQTGSVCMPKKRPRAQKVSTHLASHAVVSSIPWSDGLNTVCFT